MPKNVKKKKIIIVKKRSEPRLKEIPEEIKKTKEFIGKSKPIIKEAEKYRPMNRPSSPPPKIDSSTPVEKKDKHVPYKKGETFKKRYFDKESEFEKQLRLKKKEEEPKQRILPKKITITETITVGELAKKLNVKASELIKKLMELGELVTINKVLDADTATLVCEEFDVKTEVVSLFEETKITVDEEDKPEDYKTRAPIITIMGHVDHGKTSLLDAIRNSDVAKHEYGEITQHIGAYNVRINVEGKEKAITFLDTPGHEAFTSMRARGAQTTDIVVLLIAADDGIMKQTIESINHSKEAKVPIIVAINKIDIPGVEGNIEKIKQELTKYEIVSEEWGGDTMIIPISARQKTNIDKLLKSIVLQAELLELKANYKKLANGVVIDSFISQSKGPQATILILNGILHRGDPFVVGVLSGKVRTMYDDRGKIIEEASPATPVLITGLDEVPSAGDPFQVVNTEKYAREISQKRKELKKENIVKNLQKITLDNLYEHIKKGKIKELKIVLKADVDGSVEVLKNSLEKLSNDEVAVKIIHSATGDITESDILLAAASTAIIIGFHIRLNKGLEDYAKKEGVSIQLYRIIYDAIDDVKKALEGLLEPLVREEGRGILEVKQIFKISKVGNVLGCFVKEGKVFNTDYVKVIRDNNIIFNGKIISLKRFKDEVKEVGTGTDCGLYLGEELKDIKEGDILESYSIIKLKRTL